MVVYFLHLVFYFIASNHLSRTWDMMEDEKFKSVTLKDTSWLAKSLLYVVSQAPERQIYCSPCIEWLRLVQEIGKYLSICYKFLFILSHFICVTWICLHAPTRKKTSHEGKGPDKLHKLRKIYITSYEQGWTPK